MKREDLAWLLSMANDMRAANGDEQLDDLPDSVPDDANRCIIANAFNYGCEVSPSSNHEGGSIWFQNFTDMETYIGIVGERYRRDNKYPCAKLTPEMNDLAIAFDSGKYEEYVIPQILADIKAAEERIAEEERIV